MTRSQRSTPTGNMPPDSEKRASTDDRGGTVLGKIGTGTTESSTLPGKPADTGKPVKTEKPAKSEKLDLSERSAAKQRHWGGESAPDEAYDDLGLYPEGSAGHDGDPAGRPAGTRSGPDDDLRSDDLRIDDRRPDEHGRRGAQDFPETYPETSRSVGGVAAGEPLITPVGVMPASVRASAGTPAPPASEARALPASLPVRGGTQPAAPDYRPVERARGVEPGAPRRHASASELVSDVAGDLSMLLRKEVELAKAELRQSALRAGKGAGALGGAAGVGLFAVLFLLLAVMFGLSAVLALGWAALIVGGVLALLAAGLGLFGAMALKKVHAKPQQTVQTLKEDMQWAHGLRK